MAVTVHQAKTRLSQLIARAEAGEEIIIARGKNPVVRLTPLLRAKVRRKPGLLKGKATIPTPSSSNPSRSRNCVSGRARMTILLDSHAFVWWLLDYKRLSPSAFSAIEQDPEVFLAP